MWFSFWGKSWRKSVNFPSGYGFGLASRSVMEPELAREQCAAAGNEKQLCEKSVWFSIQTGTPQCQHALKTKAFLLQLPKWDRNRDLIWPFPPGYLYCRIIWKETYAMHLGTDLYTFLKPKFLFLRYMNLLVYIRFVQLGNSLLFS